MGVNGKPPVRNVAPPFSPPPPEPKFRVPVEKDKKPKNDDDGGGFVAGVLVGGLLS